MKLSVVMATCEGARFIETQLQSIISQSKQLDEVLIFDDASTDRTQQKIKDFIQRNNLTHWKLYVNERRLGFKENFKQGLKKSDGDIIFLCDQDDCWRNDKVEKLCSCFQSDKVLSVASGFQIIDMDGHTIDAKCNSLLDETIEKKTLFEVSLASLLKKNYAQGCTMAIRKEIVDLYTKKDVNVLEHDWSLSLLAALRNGCYFYNEALIAYRIHQDNAIGLVMDDVATVRKSRMEDRIHNILEEENRLDFVLMYSELWKEKENYIKCMKSYYTFRKACIRSNRLFSLAFQCTCGIYRKQASLSATIGDIVFILKSKFSKGKE